MPSALTVTVPRAAFATRLKASEALSTSLATRVPLIVVSPYAKAGYISHVQHDFGSILKFIETTFGLSTIGPNAGYADSRSGDGGG